MLHYFSFAFCLLICFGIDYTCTCYNIQKVKTNTEWKVSLLLTPSPLIEFSFPKATSITSFLSILYELYEMLCYIYNNYVYFTQVLFTIYSVLHVFFFYKIYLKLLPYKSITRSLHLFNDSLMFHCTDVRKYT